MSDPKESGSGKLLLHVKGMSSLHCAGIVERTLRKMDGVKKVEVNFSVEKAAVEFDPALADYERIKLAVENAGYEASMLQEGSDVEAEARQKEIAEYWNTFQVSAAFSVPLLVIFLEEQKIIPAVLPPFAAQYSAWIALALTSPVAWANRKVFIRGFRALVVNRMANMDSLVAIGVGAAFAYSLAVTLGAPGEMYYEVGTFILTFIVFGKWMEAIAKGRTSEAIKKLIGLQAKTARVIRGGMAGSDEEGLMSTDREVVLPGRQSTGHGYIGFSCVRTAEALN